MIIRIATEGQYRLSDSAVQRLDELDDRLVGIVSAKDQVAFSRVLGEMIEIVRREGTPVPLEDLVPSDIILPPPGTTVEEVSEIIKDDGVIPG